MARAGNSVRECLRDLGGEPVEFVDPWAGKAMAVNDDTVVVFVGGCTMEEVAQLRALGKKEGRKYTIITTGVITSKLVGETLPNRLHTM